MQSRVASRLSRVLISASNTSQSLCRRLASTATAPPLGNGSTADPAIYTEDPQGLDSMPLNKPPLGNGRTADPSIHSQHPPQGLDAEETVKETTANIQTAHKSCKENEPFVTPKPLHASSPKLESTGVNNPIDPTVQQKRRNSTTPTTPAASIENVSCVGMDGSPWPDDNQDIKEQRKEQKEDNREYFEHHKASPLSEIEIADTRKPITRATDGTADSSYFGDPNVIVWRPEQLDTAEDSLRRATEIWKNNAMRGDPYSPHGRVLRELRGEYW